MVTFEELFRSEYEPVLREVVFIVRDADLAKELVNEAFTRLYVRWARVSRYDKPGAWVRRVAIRLAVRREAKRSRDVELTDRGAESDSATSLDVRAAVARLSPQQRAAVMLHYFEGLPVAEVGRTLGVREGTVKAHLHQARAKLAVDLPGYEPAGC
jgi:RNA polymerase sigma-70 factor (ECF subfamily)